MGLNQRSTPFLLFATLTSLHTADTELSISYGHVEFVLV
jgi:hypothetical protein